MENAKEILLQTFSFRNQLLQSVISHEQIQMYCKTNGKCKGIIATNFLIQESIVTVGH